MEFTKTLSQSFGDFSLKRIASVLSQPAYGIDTKSKEQPYFPIWTNIVNQVFHFGASKTDLKTQVASLTQMQISKQQYYAAINAAVKKQMDRFLRAWATQPIEEEIRALQRFKDIVLKEKAYQFQQKLQKCVSASLISPTAFDLSLSKPHTSFINMFDFFSCCAEQIGSIIFQHEKVFGWGCGCEREKCSNRYQEGALFNAMFQYYCNKKTLQLTKSYTKKPVKNTEYDLELQVPHDDTCIENTIQNLIKKKKRKNRKKKRNAKNKQSDKMNEEDGSTKQELCPYNDDKTTDISTSSYKSEFEGNELWNLKKQEFIDYITRQKVCTCCETCLQIRFEQWIFNESQVYDEDDLPYKRLEMELTHFSLDEQNRLSCNVQDDWLTNLELDLKMICK